MELEHKKIVLGLFLIPNIGFKKVKKLFYIFKDWEKIWNLNYRDLINNGFTENFSNYFINQKNKINYRAIWEIHEKQNIKIINYFDDYYPNLLKQIFSPPLVLFTKGNLSLLKNTNFLSVVGSRKFDSYGKSIVEKFIPTCAEKNITIVSGLANGVDSLAHINSLDTIGNTIAVLGSDIEKPSPISNINLAKKIEKQGLIISEYGINFPYRKQNFPQRNRIIAGISQATFIVQAGIKSGALITANFALSENREVLTCPGNIFSKNQEGCNSLIRQGAKTITELNDILEIYNIEDKQKINKKINFSSKYQEIIYKILVNGALGVDKIIEYSRLNTNIVISNLTEMELNGLIKNLGGQIYELIC
ncbi:MAG TPA: DNA-processing protein DprA [bacterium]|nr:DNA-processing protein DprA [bacterium]